MFNQDVSLRERLKRDFGVDLPVNDGSGTRDAPLVVEVASPADAGMTAERVLSFLLRGRGLATSREVFWRLIESGPADNMQQRYRIEVKWFGPSEIETETVSYYFASAPTNGSVWPRAVIALDPNVQMRFPWKLGWLDYKDSAEYETETPGLGYSHNYCASGISFTAYAYPRDPQKVAMMGRAAAVESEMEAAINAITETKPGLHVLKSVRPPSWCSPDARAVLYRSNGERSRSDVLDSVLVIDHRNGVFLKLRASWIVDERGLLAFETLEAAEQILLPMGKLDS
jgi:hypothetical protein